MAADVDVFRTAYREWKAAVELYNVEIENLRTGDEEARERLTPILADLSEKHSRFMEAAKPFVYPKRSD